jgi:hypothetical protein
MGRRRSLHAWGQTILAGYDPQILRRGWLPIIDIRGAAIRRTAIRGAAICRTAIPREGSAFCCKREHAYAEEKGESRHRFVHLRIGSP